MDSLIVKKIVHAGTKVVNFVPGTKVSPIFHRQSKLYSVMTATDNHVSYYRCFFTLELQDVILPRLLLMIVEKWVNLWSWY